MDKDRKNRIFLLLIVIFLLLFVVGIALYEILGKRKAENILNISLVELYASDYELIKQGDYFLGVKDNRIHVVLSSEGKQLYINETGLGYQDIFDTRDGSFLVYNNNSDMLYTVLYDESSKKFVDLQTIDKVSYAKPIVYDGKDKTYILGFCSNDSDNLYLYNSNVGIKVLNHTSLVADKYDQTKDMYYTNTEYLVTKNSTGKMGLIDVFGNVIVDYQYENILGLKNGNYIVVNKNNTYNVIDEKNNKLLSSDYQYIGYKDGLYFVMKNNKIALYDDDLNQISGFIMNHNIDDLTLRENNYLNSKKVGNKYYMWNNDEVRDFSYNQLFVISNKKDYKSYDLKNFAISDYLYSYDNGELIIYDDNFDEIKKIDIGADIKYILNVVKIENESLYVEYINNDSLEEDYCYINSEGNIYKNKYGKLFKKTDNYLIYRKNKELTIVDYKGIKLNSITGDSVKLYGSYLIVDNNLYRIIIK